MRRKMHTASVRLCVPLLLLVPMAVARSQDRVPAPPRAESTGNPPELDQQLLEGLEPGTAGRADPQSPPPAIEQGDPGAVGRDAQDASVAGSDIGPQNPLGDIEQRMRLVEQRLRRKELANETQQTQREIVVRLDALIAALSESLQTEQSQASSAEKPAEEDPQTAEAGSVPARDATGQTDGEQVTTDSRPAIAVQRTADQVWGHLPERLREQMQTAEAIEFLPQYRQLIENYFQRLAGERGLPP